MNMNYRIAFVISIVLAACNNDSTQERFVALLKMNDITLLKAIIKKPIDTDLSFVVENKIQLENEYSFSISDSILIMNSVNGEIKIEFKINGDSILLTKENILNLFCFESNIRHKIALYNYGKGEYSEALRWMTINEPINNDSLIALIYFNTYQLDSAQYYFEKSFSKGNLNSGVYLCDIYTLMNRREEAIKLLKGLAEKNHAGAMVRLGDYYDTYSVEFGYDPPKDATDDDSFNWFQKAAELGNSIAMTKLGFIYAEGINHEVNYDSAYYWYSKSASLGSNDGLFGIANLYLSGVDGYNNIDSGLSIIGKVISKNPAEGYFEMGNIYDEGIGVEKNRDKALFYYYKSDSLGNNLAKLQIKRLERMPKSSNNL
jgi:TPR repeat protein